MTIFQANLKHLYQRKAMLFLFLFFALLFTAVIASFVNEGGGAILGVLLLVFYIGLFIAALQIEIMTKPFSYCLPGHGDVPVKFMFWVCVIISLVPSLAFLFRIEVVGFALVLLRCLTVFLLSTVFYWLGVWVTFGNRNWSVAMALFGFAPLVGIWTRDNTAIEGFIFGNWFVILLLAIGVNYLASRLLRDDGLARKYCGKMWMGALDPWNREKLVKFQQVKLKEKEERTGNKRQYLSLKVEEFFLSKISDRSMNDTARHIWSGLYRTFAVLVSTSRWPLLITWPLVICFLCYIGPASGILYVMPAFMAIQMSLHVRSPLLISGGRKERFYSALVLAMTVSVLVILTVLSIVVFSKLIAPVMPSIMFKGREMVFTQLNVKMSFLPLLIIPLAFTCNQIFPKQTILSKVLPMIVIMIGFQFFVIMGAFKKSIPMEDMLPLLVVGGIVLSWGLFVLVLRYVCMRRCLVSN